MKLLAEAAPARAAPELTASHSGSYVLRVVELDERAAREDAVLTRGNARVERRTRHAPPASRGWAAAVADVDGSEGDDVAFVADASAERIAREEEGRVEVDDGEAAEARGDAG